MVHKRVKISLRRQGFENKIAIRYETNMVTVHLEIQLTAKVMTNPKYFWVFIPYIYLLSEELNAKRNGVKNNKLIETKNRNKIT